ncbi:Molybdopterin biosynthesis protein MoeY [Candidatus Methylobacter favarea]|uniref:Molybdopterin biosynthesis protein MoeY n=1 Tax=Candidatus Methylobacter favarea TaxID=2707345 RepID=A0A8S0XS82_9GAMM|nr:nitroreductase family protein [Candidatus Methylobacter favarea]CAA9890572.1 Molybdopterin biosynthesis protein MoeY [Candidatus Methylobacter favarea]
MGKEPQTLIEKILENARWAPSGDNMQTWRFEIIDASHFVVHGYDTRDHCVYDLQGHASQLAIGALLESIAIAAREFGHPAEFRLRVDTSETKPTVDVLLTENIDIAPDPLFACLPIRSVQRRVLKTTALTPEQKTALQQAVGDFYTVKWIEGFKGRWQAARLMYKNAKLRLTLPEAFPTHSTVIEWDARFSDDKIPDQAVGLDPIATKLMKWAMKSWGRVSFLNTYCFGTLLPRIELDLLPGICCAAHFAIIARHEPETMQDFLNAGRALQRFWLTATQLGLQMQPEMTPLIFYGYIQNQVAFTRQSTLVVYAKKLAHLLDSLVGAENTAMAVFMGRIGQGQKAASRSHRLGRDQLIIKSREEYKAGENISTL